MEGFRSSLQSPVFLSLIIGIMLINILGALASPWDQRGSNDEALNSPDKWPLQQGQTAASPADYNLDQGQGLYLDKLVKLINSKRRISGSRWTPFADQLDSFPSHQKRQVRYHQCYFNPISCFRKRK